MIRKIIDKISNPFNRILKEAKQKGATKFLIPWNRGLGDLALGLCCIVHKIRKEIPDAKVTFLTRENLKDGFSLLDQIDVIVAKDWKRGNFFDIDNTLQSLGLKKEDFDVIIEKPDPNKWLKRSFGKYIPKLKWSDDWDLLSENFGLDKDYIGIHIDTETGIHYGYEKNWPKCHWKVLLGMLTKRLNRKVLLFGCSPEENFEIDGVIDLRGKTSLLELLSIIKNKCSALVVPDSGILSLIYYININFPLKIISLWADPKLGVLRQAVSSPNSELMHIPLIGKKKDLYRIPPLAVIEAIFSLDKKRICTKNRF